MKGSIREGGQFLTVELVEEVSMPYNNSPNVRCEANKQNIYHAPQEPCPSSDVLFPSLLQHS